MFDDLTNRNLVGKPLGKFAPPNSDFITGGTEIMRFTFCPHCGTKLIGKEIGDEGVIPFCEKCNIPLWDMFTTSIIAAVVNEYDEIALLRQNYVSATKYGS